ncbi:unnamed protein product, partial [Rotaria socialis]
LHGGNSSDESNLNVSSASSIIQHLDVVLDSIRQENQKYFVQLSKKIKNSNHVNDIDISAYGEPGTSQTQEDVVSVCTKISTCFLFEGKALKTMLGGEHFARKPLDNQRFEKLHRVLRYKCNISGSRYEFFHKLIRPKLVDFLSDERKRARKSETTKSPPSSLCDQD